MDEILADFPTLTEENVRAVIAFAAASAEEDLPVSESPPAVADENLVGQSDEAIWNACLTEGRFLITQDLDFSDIRRFQPGTHPGILLLRLARPGRRALAARVLRQFDSESVDEWLGSFVVATDRKLRVRRPW